MESSLDPKKCFICCKNPIKYTCPRCSIRTCSLSCCLIHKKTLKCNGQRDRTSFKSLDTMNDLDLLSDYRFLEEVNGQIETSKRDELANKMKSFNELTYYQKSVQNKLKTLGSIQILYLPKFSTRHKQNQMWFDKNTGQIFWHIECRFYIDTFYRWTITRLSTNETTLSNLLKKFHEHLNEKFHMNDNAKNLMKLRSFFDEEQIGVYIENFGQKRKQFGKYEKRSFNTILDLFHQRIFIEYPILFISLIKDEEKMKENLLRKTSN